MTVTSIITRQPLDQPATAPATPTAQHPLVAALLTVADNRANYTAGDWATVLEGFGSSLDDIADDLDTANEYANGHRDHEVRTAAAADATADRLRHGAGHSAAFLASLLRTGALS